MTEPSDRWRRVEDICHAALARPANQHPAFLGAECGDDDDLRHEVETLLAKASAAERFLETPVGAAAAQVIASVIPPRAGRRFGVFEVGGLLGSGGMGDVYRARDTRLDRSVALKVLPPEFTADPERLARVEREARVLASLNHPHIAAIYALEQVDGVSGLILELVEGPTLADRLARGRCPLDDTLRIARQIVDALDAAHEKGIAHRDLKPGNIKITPDGVVKLLDFGLAKEVESAAASADRPHSARLPVAGTRAGVAWGTAAYMAPEQARGQVVDRRADIWAFGVVVYEMLTGARPFDGESTSDILAAVLNKEPEWSALPSGFPPRVEELLRLCLVKDRKRRLQAIGDARIFLNAPAEDALSSTGVARRSILGWSVAGLLALGLPIEWWARSRLPNGAVDQPFLQLDLDTGPDEVSQVAISADGTRIVFVSSGHLAVRRLDEGKVTSLARTEGASNPFFSPDGESVAFFAQGTLKKMSLGGGAPVSLCDARNFFGGTWGDDDTIIAAMDETGELLRVPAVGGTPQPITKAPAAGTTAPTRNWPQALPQGQGVLFGAGNGSGQGSLRVLTPQHAVKTLVEDSTHGRYLASGHLVYHQEGTLFAAPMDPVRLELTGPAVPLVEGVSYANGRANFDLSASGTLVYSRNTAGSDLVVSWLGAEGTNERLPLQPGNYRQPRLSPEGTRLALSVIQGRQQNLWVYDIRRDRFTQLTFGADRDWHPTWTPDGEFLAFRSGNGLAWIRSDGSGAVERLDGVSANAAPSSFSGDGKWLAFWPIEPYGEAWIVPVERTGPALRLGTPRPLPQAGPKGGPAISPDGRWLAYTSYESGRSEVYVTPFEPRGTPSAGKWPVSNDGGFAPVWSDNGRDLFFQSRDGHIQVAAYARQGDSFEVEKPRSWSETRLAYVGLSSGYDVAPDGTRVVALLASAKPEMFLHVLLNVGSELRRRASAAGK